MAQMTNLSQLSSQGLKYIFTDIDDTLTLHGKLSATAYSALWGLHRAGYKIIPVTGRPAGWCELIVRLWPVEAVIGENGGFYFHFDGPTLKRHFANSSAERQANQAKLALIKKEVLESVPGTAVASDQFTRLMDLAIDFCEDVPPLSKSDVNKIVKIYEKHGAQAKVSSIHVNGWFGSYNKISMIKEFCSKHLGTSFEKLNSQCLFVGDSPNDEPSFQDFLHSAGVANIKRFLPDMQHHPTWVLNGEGGNGFVELSQALLS